MCGICGFIGKGTIDDLKAMNNSIIHRGPDDEGLWSNESLGIYLGHRRLSIIDIVGGKQPMWTQNATHCIVFNGEIYNHKELRIELLAKGYKFQTNHSDTEVLLNGYLEWGNNLPNKLNGMWAFAIYNKSNSQIFLCRDRFGKKPLFYSFQNGSFVFASELSSLIKHRNIQLKFSSKNLKKYFAYGYIPSPNTIYEGIYKLSAGHSLCLDIRNLSSSISKYWDFVLEPYDTIPKNPEKIWGEELLDLLEKAVKRRLMSDVPLGVFLSGGVDSSSIVALASKNITNNKLKTFSIGFEEASFDESLYANTIASLFETEHHLEMFSIEKAKSFLPEIISKLDEPMGDSSLLPTYLLCNETRKHVTVAIGGDGADELFAGYDPFRALQFAKFYNAVTPQSIHQAILMFVSFLPTSHNNMSLDFKIKRTLRGLSYPQKIWNTVWLGPLEPKEIGELFLEPVNIEEIYSEAIEQWDNCKQQDIANKTLQFYTKLYLQDDILVKVDRASMMNSLEVRAPFLDIDLVNFVRKIPYAYKYRKGQSKYILKKALESILPNNILYRSKKGFGVPIGKWFKEGTLALDKNSPLPLLNSKFILSSIAEHKKNKTDNRAFLWNVWLFQKWNQKQHH